MTKPAGEEEIIHLSFVPPTLAAEWRLIMNVRLIRKNGVIKVEINGEIIEPLSFKSFRPTDRNISDFSKAGVRLFSIFTTGLNSILGVPYSLYGESWIDNKKYDFQTIDNQIELFIRNAPNAYFALMIQVDTRNWYLEDNPGCPNSFFCLSQIAGDDKWRNAAAEYLKAVIQHVEDKYGERFYGYFMMGGTTTEWFSFKDHAESHPYKEIAYKKYMNNPNITIPCKEKREQSSNGSFKNPVLDKESIDYCKFHHEIIADTILFFASKVQEVIKHKKLLGVYFGYLLELLNEGLWDYGHLAYEKVFLSDDIDMISSPSSYLYRNHSGTSAFMVTYDTLALHNKLYYLEFDHITHLAPQFVEGHGIPGYESKFSDEQQTISVMRRDFMLCVSKGAALWWFDMFEGWFYSHSMMNEIKLMMEISKKLSCIQHNTASEIAVFAEGETLYYVNQNIGINTDILGRQREGLMRMGAPYDVFSICDIDNSNINHDQYKLYIFLDSFKMSDKTKKIIEEKIKANGKTVLWIYAPDYIQENNVSIKCISDMTGIKLKLSNNTNSLVNVDYANDGVIIDKYSFNDKVVSLFYADDNEATVWGRYDSDNTAALVYKKFENYNSFYSSVGNLPANVLRNIAVFAGVHIYNYGTDPVYVNSRLIGVYSDTDGEINLRLKADTELVELFDGGVYKPENKILKISVLKGNAKLFIPMELS